MCHADDDYVDLLAGQLGTRAHTQEDFADDLADGDLADAPLELARATNTPRWRTGSTNRPPLPGD
jgi:hypothetical protein